MKTITRFFLSLKTASFFFFIFILLAVTGSLVLPENLAFFSGIDETPLFVWLAGSKNLNLTWWIYALIVVLGLLAVSTIFCTAEAFLRRIGWKNFMLRLSPQIMHIGVVFIMLGHLLTASQGFKTDMLFKKGDVKQINDRTQLRLEDVKVITDRNGYDTDWEARLNWIDAGKEEEGILRPVHPLYFGKTGIYFRSVGVKPEPFVLIRICRDPGALWALLGGALLSLGGIGFIYGRFRTGKVSD